MHPLNNNPDLGQILPGSLFGLALTMMTFESEVIVESGTWKGLGSTLCIYNGLTRPEQRFWTIEPDEAMWEFAKSHYTDPRITFLNGRTLDLIYDLPEQIGLLLLDGGITDGYEEFKALAPRSRYVALDDTLDVKNQQAYMEALTAGWKVIADYPDQRNGWAIFQRH